MARRPCRKVRRPCRKVRRPCKKARASSSYSQPASSWPDLPPDIAGEVLGRLPSYADRIYFGAVCRSWRSSARQHHARPLLPCLCFADGTFGGFPAEARPFRLRSAAGHHSSCGEWLVFEREDGAYSLVDPFSQDSAPVALLPSLSRVRVRHEPIVAVGERDLPDCRHPWTPRERDVEPQTAVSMLKLVVCSASLAAAVVGQGRHGKLALCRPDAASTWSVSGREPWRRLKDMAYYQGKLYVVDQNEDLLVVTVDENDGDLPTISRLDRVVKGRPPFADFRRRVTLHYLVESGDGALLMVRREISRARERRVAVLWTGDEMDEEITMFEADFRSSTWKEVEGALGGGGQALFVGRWCSRAVRVPDERRAEWADRIFFLEDGTGEEWRMRSLRYSLSVYMMKGVDFDWCDLPRRGRAESLLPLVVSWSGDDLPATWIFPQDRTNLRVAGPGGAPSP